MQDVEPIAYSIPEAARALSTTEGAVRMKIQRGRLPVQRVGRRLYVLQDDLLTYVRGQR